MSTQKFGRTRKVYTRRVAYEFCSDIPCISSKALLALSTSTQHQGLTALLTVVNH